MFANFNEMNIAYKKMNSKIKDAKDEYENFIIKNGIK